MKNPNDDMKAFEADISRLARDMDVKALEREFASRKGEITTDERFRHRERFDLKQEIAFNALKQAATEAGWKVDERDHAHVEAMVFEASGLRDRLRDEEDDPMFGLDEEDDPLMA